MSKINEIYKCTVFGNIIEVLHAGKGELVCCGQPMDLMAENTVDAAKEKYVPVITKVADGYKVAVRSVAHPMEVQHFIEWIELVAHSRIYRQNLEPGKAPGAMFCIKADKVSVREYCNIHGLWKA